MPREADMRAFWDERARENAFFFVDDRLRYDRVDLERFWSKGERDLEMLLDATGVELSAGDSVVEVGCGVGRLTRPIARVVAHVDALDVSAEMLEIARRENPELENVRWIEGDGETLAGVADSSADACISHVVFQHIPDPEITLGYVREMGRVLRPGGWAAFQFSNDPSVHRRRRESVRPRALARRVRDAVRRRPRPRGREHPAWLGSAVDIGDLCRAADDGGMDVAHVAFEGTQYCVARLRRRP